MCTGPYWEDDTNLRMFKQYLIDFLAQHVGVDVDHWLSVKNRILYLRQMDPFMFLWTVGQELLQQKSYQVGIICKVGYSFILSPRTDALKSNVVLYLSVCRLF